MKPSLCKMGNGLGTDADGAVVPSMWTEDPLG